MKFSFLDTLDPTQPHILLIRHAERFAVTSLVTAAEALLTKKGEKAAFVFGRRLDRRFGPVRLFHSPVERCLQTADCIRDGILAEGGAASLEGPLDWLGGDFIRAETAYLDGRLAEEGPVGFMRRWFNGSLPEDKIVPSLRGGRIELGFLHRQLDGREGLVVDVTHDWNLMLLLEHFLNLRHEEIGFPPFMACLVASRSGSGRLILEYRGTRVESGDWL